MELASTLTMLACTIYSYVLVKDTGMAPCVRDGMLSLALCKVGIRQVVGKKNKFGDVLVGLWPSHKGQPQYIRYIAIVSHIITLEEYYAPNSIDRKRKDCIYEWADGKLLRLDGRFHADNKNPRNNFEDQRKDREGYVLMCDKFHFYDYNDAPEANYMKSYLTRNYHTDDDDEAMAFNTGLLNKEGFLTAHEGNAQCGDDAGAYTAAQNVPPGA